MKLTLMHKGLLLVSIPVCFEIGMFSVLIGLQDQVEREAQRLDHKRQVNESVNNVIRDVAKVGIMKKRYQQEHTATAQDLQLLVENILGECLKLEKLTKDDPELLHSVLLSKKAILDAKDEFKNVRIELRKASSPEEFKDIMINSRKRLDSDLALALNAGVLDLANKTEPGADLEKNVQDRHQITMLLRYALWMSAGLGITLAILYSRNLSSRVMRLKENAALFAERQPLLDTMKGNDEIADLDRAFHEATNLVEIATRKERAILENASDLIFSLDEDLLITSANPSAEAIIGKSAGEIIGEPLTSFIVSEDATRLKSEFKQMVKAANKSTLEVRLLTAKAEPSNVVVSASYSPSDESFYCILHDVTAQRQMENLRQEVTAMITHDLRTPLQTIRNYLEMLKNGMLGNLNEQGNKLLHLTDKESQRMNTLIDGVLTLEKLRSGNMTLNLDMIDLQTLLEDCARSLELVARDKGITIKLEPFKPLKIQGDRVWLEQVILNILGNALKFSPAKTQITMSAAFKETNKGADKVEIRVKDQGPGIPAEDLGKIFDRFYRVQSAAHKSGQKSGAGLGLNICKELIKLHDGSITCESESSDGSTFIIVLPIAPGVLR